MGRNVGDSNGLRRAAMAAPLLGPEEERELAIRAQRGDERAQERLVCSHLRLVYPIAHEFRYSGVSRDDLVSEGMLALVVAVGQFDPTYGTRLASYAGHWIRAMLRRFTQRNRRVVRAPSTRNGREVLANIHRVERELYQASGERPDRETIAAALGVPVSDVEEVAHALHARDVPVASDRAAGAVDVVSSEPDPETLVARAEERRNASARLSRALHGLGERERCVVQSRLLQETPRTLDALGAGLGISRERVRQIESRAYAKLRATITESVA